MQTRAEFVETVAELVAGLQVPLSLGMPLGAARKPLVDLLTAGRSFGWTNEEELVAAFNAVLDQEVPS